MGGESNFIKQHLQASWFYRCVFTCLQASRRVHAAWSGSLFCATRGKKASAVKSLPLGCLLIGSSELVFMLLISKDWKRLVLRQVVHFTAGSGFLGRIFSVTDTGLSFNPLLYSFFQCLHISFPSVLVSLLQMSSSGCVKIWKVYPIQTPNHPLIPFRSTTKHPPSPSKKNPTTPKKPDHASEDITLRN